MVDKTARADLADKLDLLVTGKMTNDEFDVAYYSRWLNAKDDAVREIAKFAWGLYSSDLLFPYRLTGSNKLPQQAIDTAGRVKTFLATEQCYPWPINVKGVSNFGGCFIPWNIAIFIVGLFLALMKGYFALYLVIFGVLTFCIGLHWLLTYQQRRAELDHFHASGDIEAWPFISKEEWRKAEKQPDAFSPLPPGERGRG